jgi:hypothetical protein
MPTTVSVSNCKFFRKTIIDNQRISHCAIRVVADFFEISRESFYIYTEIGEFTTNHPMKRTIFTLAFLLFCLPSFGQVVYNGVIVSKPDSTIVQKRVAQWKDSLNNHNFSEDAAKLREEVELFGEKAKQTIEKHTPVVKELMQSIADYFKR